MNINMPRDKETGKPKGFAFLMYEDQRSTILAVDNLNGATILERTIRVDHVKNYKEKRVKNQDGEWMDPEEQSFNAKPEVIIGPLSGFHLPIFRPRPLTPCELLQVMLHRSLRNPISLRILTLRIPCVTSSLRNVGKKGLARKRSTRSTRMKRLRRDEHGRNVRRKRRRKKGCRRESRTSCVMWKSCSNP